MSAYLEVLDTPGTLWPSFEEQRVAKRLAYIGSIKEEILDVSELALEFIKDILEIKPELLSERYGVDVTLKPIEIYEGICKKRGFMAKGGEFDYERGARSVLDDFRKGRLGRLTLDKLSEVNEADDA